MFDNQKCPTDAPYQSSLTTLQCFPNRPFRRLFRRTRQSQSSMHRHPPPIRVRSPTEMLVANFQRRRQQRINQYHQIIREVRWLAFCKWRRANTPGLESLEVQYPCPTSLCPSSGFPSQNCSLCLAVILPQPFTSREIEDWYRFSNDLEVLWSGFDYFLQGFFGGRFSDVECMAMSWECFSREGKGPVRLMEALAGVYLGEYGRVGAWEDWNDVSGDEVTESGMTGLG